MTLTNVSRLVVPCLVLAATAVPAGADADPGARRVLDEARAACVGVRSAAYDGACQTTSGSSGRETTGQVQFSKFDYSDRIGGRLVIDGKEVKAGGRSSEFTAAYNGAHARRLMPDKQKMLQGDLNFGGEAVLESTGYDIVMRALLEESPFAEELRAPALALAGAESVGEVQCDVVEVTYAESGTTGRWWIAREDRLPRRHERHYKSANGRDVTSSLTVSGLVIGATIAETVFDLEAPDGWKVETVGRRPPPPINVGDMAPDFTLLDAEGREVSLRQFQGQVVVLEFWSSWCHYCKESMPALQRLHDKWSGKGAAVLAINCRDTADVDPGAFVRGKGYTYPVIPDGNAVAPQYRISGIPHVFVIGTDGRLIQSQVGFGEATESRLDVLINKHRAQ